MAEPCILGPYPDKRIESWRCKVTTDAFTRWVSGRTADEALNRARELRDRPGGCTPTVLEAVKRYIDTRIKGDRWAPASIKRAKIDLAELAEPPETSVSRLDRAFLLRYVKRTERLALATRKKRWVTIAAFLRWCVVQGWLVQTPVARIDSTELPWTGRRARERMGAGKFQLPNGRSVLAYLAAARALPTAADRLAAQLPVLTGLRNGELRHLRVGDVDLVFNLFWVRSSKFWTGRDDDWSVKTAKSTRQHPIPPELLSDLKLVCSEPDGSARPDASFLFEVRWSQAKGKTQVTRHKERWLVDLVHKVCKLAGLPRVVPHSLRGTYASVLIATGCEAANVAARLGHGDHGATLRNAYQGAPVVVPALSLPPNQAAEWRPTGHFQELPAL